MKREVVKYDFKAFVQAIKATRKAKGISRNELANQMKQIFNELVTLLDVSVDQLFYLARFHPLYILSVSSSVS